MTEEQIKLIKMLLETEGYTISRKKKYAAEVVERDDVGNVLRTLRKQKGLSQHDLAVVLETTTEQIAKIESGLVRPLGADVRARLCRAFDLSPEKLSHWLDRKAKDT